MERKWAPSLLNENQEANLYSQQMVMWVILKYFLIKIDNSCVPFSKQRSLHLTIHLCIHPSSIQVNHWPDSWKVFNRLDTKHFPTCQEFCEVQMQRQKHLEKIHTPFLGLSSGSLRFFFLNYLLTFGRAGSSLLRGLFL